MFEFSFSALLAAILAGILIYHFAGKKLLGWVTKEEAALHADLTLIKHRLAITETALNPPTAAPVVPEAVNPVKPANPAPAAAPAAPAA